MAAGLRIWDANGNLTFDSANFTTTRYIGQTRISGTEGTYTDSKINNRPVWIMVIKKESSSMLVPAFSSSGNTISWETATKSVPGGHGWVDWNGDQNFTIGGWIDIIYGAM